MIKLVRIDDRLLHGQVAFAWSKHYDINIILVANDNAAQDKTKQMALKMAKPPSAKLYIKSVEDAIKDLPKLDNPKMKALVIIDSTKDAKSLVDASDNIKSINVGGIRMAEGKKLISRAVAVDGEDIKNLKSIEENIEVEVRQVPNDTKKLFKNLV
ncbi:PTS system mannose-specific EIIAB component [Oceanobacillus oncorhynchi]|uniref:PTS system mannose-specific EIIAB component n=1 Tax=Oceanobacillus oncorhynchi TaxID=545501 RepID=A0A0A1MCZ7_9BACI|nr:PTS sugar transporter subunit IIB [Oceanobacillus oncorhynchi]CEI80948.1 PTS system mannose-specific EIIAB component [Oceanobacillus oncorhynchi]